MTINTALAGKTYPTLTYEVTADAIRTYAAATNEDNPAFTGSDPVGPPGCAKSLLLDALMRWLSGRRFSVLLNRFTVPEEVLGPVSLSALKADRYVRVTAGKLPEADFAFLDEVWKASSAILNTLLKILNERVYDAGLLYMGATSARSR